MEEKKRIFNTLNSIDFEEFVNIPRPVITIFEVFRQCFAEESRRVTDLHLEINKMTEKVQYKLQSMNEVLANTNESIHHQQEHIMNKMKERSEFLKNDLNVFKVKLNEENISKQKIFDETLSEMKEKLDDCVKIVNSVMTKEEVSKEISDKSTSLHIAICNEVRDQIFKPANDKLTLEIKAISDKNQKSGEQINTTLKALEKKVSEENNSIISNLHNFHQEQISQNENFAKLSEDLAKEIQESNKKIDFYQSKSIEIEKNFHLNHTKTHRDISSLNEKILKINEKIDNYENQQKSFTRTALSSKTHKAPKEIIRQAQPNSTILIESELAKVKNELEASLVAAKQELLKQFEENIKELERNWARSKATLEEATCEIKDKLAWLPINLTELKGMGPSDARLFTIEARLRAEENSRIQAMSTIEKSIEGMKKSTVSPLHFKSPIRRATPDLKNSIDRLARFTENSKERINTSMFEGIIFDTYELKKSRRRISRGKTPLN